MITGDRDSLKYDSKELQNVLSVQIVWKYYKNVYPSKVCLKAAKQIGLVVNLSHISQGDPKSMDSLVMYKAQNMKM